MVASNTVMDFQSDYSKKVYVAPKGVSHSSSDATIRNTYTCVGTIPANPDGNGSDFWVGDIAVDYPALTVDDLEAIREALGK